MSSAGFPYTARVLGECSNFLEFGFQAARRAFCKVPGAPGGSWYSISYGLNPTITVLITQLKPY